MLEVKIERWNGTAPLPTQTHGTWAIPNRAEADFGRFFFDARGLPMRVVTEDWSDRKQTLTAGTLLVDIPRNDARLNRLPASLGATRLQPLGPNAGQPKTREVRAPRIALLHTWISTQDEGWWRLALESMNVPYDYLSTQDVAGMSNLRQHYDVVLFPPVSGSRVSPQEIVNGLPPGPPLPWKTTALTPNLGGVDETDDMRPGLGLAGVQNLQRFVEDGGLLITSRDTSAWAIHYGLARWVTVVDTTKLKAPGTIVRGSVTDKTHPIARGYDETLPLYFSGGPVFRTGYRLDPTPQTTRPTGRGGKDDPDVPQGRPFVPTPEQPKPGPGESGFMLPEDAPWNVEAILPRPEDRPKVVISFAEKDVLLSGMLEGADEIAGKPAVISVPRGKGHVILMSTNPMWRGNTSGLYALIINAMLEMSSAP